MNNNQFPDANDIAFVRAKTRPLFLENAKYFFLNFRLNFLKVSTDLSNEPSSTYIISITSLLTIS
jgi:hypothetical protein